MDLFARMLLRAALWLRRPPSRRFVIVLMIAAAAAAVIAGLEALGLWPDWAHTERLPRHVPMR